MYVQVSHLLWLIFLWLELPWVLSAMADARSRCLLDGPVCDLLLKSHVRNLDDAVFFQDDTDSVVEQYLGFLAAVARVTTRLKVSLVSASACRVFGCCPATGCKFGAAMVAALHWCYEKGRKASSGCKLSDSVKTVCLAFKHVPKSLHDLQGSLLQSPASMSKGSSSSSICTAQPYKGASPVAAAAAFGVGAATAHSSKATIRRLYGLPEASPPSKKREVAADIFSSQEVPSSPEGCHPIHADEPDRPALAECANKGQVVRGCTQRCTFSAVVRSL